MHGKVVYVQKVRLNIVSSLLYCFSANNKWILFLLYLPEINKLQWNAMFYYLGKHEKSWLSWLNLYKSYNHRRYLTKYKYKSCNNSNNKSYIVGYPTCPCSWISLYRHLHIQVYLSMFTNISRYTYVHVHAHGYLSILICACSGISLYRYVHVDGYLYIDIFMPMIMVCIYKDVQVYVQRYLSKQVCKCPCSWISLYRYVHLQKYLSMQICTCPCSPTPL